MVLVRVLRSDFKTGREGLNTTGGLTLAEEPGPVLGGVEDAPHPDSFRLDSVENQVIPVARNRPKAYADFLFTAWLPQSYSFLWHISKLEALLDEGGPDARGSGWVASRNVVFDLVEVFLGQRSEKDRQAFHRR
jgi:hypothetical protein